MAIEPNSLFKVWSPDFVAECLEFGSDLYQKIWSEIVPLYNDQPPSEVHCLAQYWSKFTDEEKFILNALAERDGHKWSAH
jgi:hypothetical protein